MRGASCCSRRGVAAIIESAGFDVKRSTRPAAKAPILVRSGRVSGEVIIDVRSPGKDAVISTQSSGDGGLTWVQFAKLPNTRHVSGSRPSSSPPSA
jgi:hypothetical protein